MTLIPPPPGLPAGHVWAEDAGGTGGPGGLRRARRGAHGLALQPLSLRALYPPLAHVAGGAGGAVGLDRGLGWSWKVLWGAVGLWRGQGGLMGLYVGAMML